VYVPWKPAVVRLDTYSGAPVDFTVYNVDPAEVIVAGQSSTPRALDTTNRRPLLHWRFSPPSGYRFNTSDVDVPLGNQEGFYVVEARRGNAVQQVWLNRTHVGLVTKEGPEGILVWGVDLRSGRAIAGMNVAFLVGLRLVTKRTDARGLIIWHDPGRPSFALADDGAGRAFVSLLPQAPLPATIVGLRVESAAARAGEIVRFVGFARARDPNGYRRASGFARVTLLGRGTILATTLAPLDAAGAFAGELAIPVGIESGDYALLASAGGGIGGTDVHVDAAGDVSLSLALSCPCDPARDVPFSVVARHADVPAPGETIHVFVVRTPHVVPPGAVDASHLWGTTVVYDGDVRTDETGRAGIVIPSPSDGLDSTYGISATVSGASATSSIIVPNGRVALALRSDAASVDVGAPAAFDVRAFDPTDGSPVPDLAVTLRLSHGATVQEQTAPTDARGAAHVVFARTSLGSNLALASATVDGRHVLDATAVSVEPSALSGTTVSAESEVAMSVNAPRYRLGERVGINASADGAAGDALVTLDGGHAYEPSLASVSHGAASTVLDLGEPLGAVRAWVAFIRDGAVAFGSTNVNVDGPGHARETELSLDKQTYAPGELLHATIHDGADFGPATIALRIADGRESGPALFDDAPDVMSVGVTNEQTSASDDPEWHAYVEPRGSTANDIFAAERPRKVPAEVAPIGVAAPRTMLWQVLRVNSTELEVPVPARLGHYVLSILKMSDDGSVGAASISFDVE